MKKLVKKIALPGAILAFAMALFGGTTYAYSALNNVLTYWQGVGDQSLDNTRGHINTLVDRIKDLKDSQLENDAKMAILKGESEKLTQQVKSLTEEKEELSKEKEELSKQLTTLQATSSSDVNAKSALQNKIKELERNLKEKEKTISQNNIDLATNKTQIEKRAEAHEKIVKKNLEYYEQKKALEAQVKALKDKSTNEEQLIKSLEHHVYQLTQALKDVKNLESDAEKSVADVEKYVKQ